MFLLDTNVCIQFMNGTSLSVRENFQRRDPAEISICSIVKAELLFGAKHSNRAEENLLCVKRFYAPFDSLPFDDSCAEEYSRIRSELSRQGNLIGPNDLFIAAAALAYDAILITNNTREFQRVSGLRLED
ncbi:MAG: type II toxin-antitoxin system VapC family toxin [Phormidesmis sp.]